MGGTDTMVHVPMISPIQKPGHVTSGMMHKCKHSGTRPETGESSSCDCAAVHLGKIDEQCMLMYDEKHLGVTYAPADMACNMHGTYEQHNKPAKLIAWWARLRSAYFPVQCLRCLL